MNETKFKVGDRVRAITDCSGNRKVIGKIGTVRKIFEQTHAVGVEFDEYIDGHDIDGDFKHGYCWNFHEYEVEPIHNNHKIVITTDGKTTTAKMYDGKKLVNSAKAICSPDDEFDFERGAGIAISRLLGWDFVPVEEEHFYNGKVVCVSNGCYETAFTVGKIYEITEGELKAESCAYLTEIKKVSDINEYFKREGVKFLEIVE